MLPLPRPSREWVVPCVPHYRIAASATVDLVWHTDSRTNKEPLISMSHYCTWLSSTLCVLHSTSVAYHSHQISLLLSYNVGICSRSQNFLSAWPHQLGRDVAILPRDTLHNMCYPAEFLRCRSNRTLVAGITNIWETLESSHLGRVCG